MLSLTKAMNKIISKLSKTPYLVLFIVLISIGVGTAAALGTITLAGDTHTTGDAVVDGKITSSGYEFLIPVTKKISYSKFESFDDEGPGIDRRVSMYGIPDGAKIISMRCLVLDLDSDGRLGCHLIKTNGGGEGIIGQTQTLRSFAGGEFGLSTGISETVDRELFSYHVEFVRGANCDVCSHRLITLTYTIDKVHTGCRLPSEFC